MTPQHRPVTLWYQYEAGSVLVPLKLGEGLVFGREHAAYKVQIDLAPLSRRVDFVHCRLWYIRRAFVVYNLCRPRQATFLAREVKDRAAKAGEVKIQVGDAPDPMLLSLKPVEVEAIVDLSQDYLFLVEPTAPHGHVLVRFRPAQEEGHYSLEVHPCKVLEIVPK